RRSEYYLRDHLGSDKGRIRVRQGSDTCRVVVRPVSERCQTSVRPVSERCQTSVRPVSEQCQTSVGDVPEKGQISVENDGRVVSIAESAMPGRSIRALFAIGCLVAASTTAADAQFRTLND